MAQDSPQAKYSEQYVLNQVYDTLLKALAVISVGYDGVNTQIPQAEALATKITVSGNYTYIGVAAPRTAQATAKWRVKRVDQSTPGTTIITWANGDAEFDNVATDLTALSYS